MQITQVVQEIGTDMEESQNQRDRRVEELWQKLDPQKKGELDIKGLRKGLRKMDHPLKNADNMIQQVMQVLDTNKDGKIQYEEFRVFVEATEKQLLLIFKNIDRNHDGRVGLEELQSAFQRAGITVASTRLKGFFAEVDMNHDGYITWDEWRNFLLFMPSDHDGSPLEAALTFYSSIVSVNAEGDSTVTAETLQGAGTGCSPLDVLFGSITRIAHSLPPSPYHLHPGTPPMPGSGRENEQQSRQLNPSKQLQGRGTSDDDMMPQEHASCHAIAAGSVPDAISIASTAATNAAAVATIQAAERAAKAAKETSPGRLLENTTSEHVDYLDIHDHDSRLPLREIDVDAEECADQLIETTLTSYLPEPGYFIAGAAAGGVSRTATAPLDRLKVFLLVNTQTKAGAAIDTAKRGEGVQALRTAGRPIRDAVFNLYKTGGFRTFFAGNGLNVIKIMPETAIKFGSYEFAKRTLANLEGHGDPTMINPYSKFAAGGVAGMTAQFCVYPLDTLKFRLQCETVKGGPTGNALLVQTAQKMIAEGAFRTAYRGITMGLVGMFPYSAIDMGTFELLKKNFTRYKARYYGIHEEDAAPGNITTAIIGATSGAFGASVVYPLNVLRTRLQTQGTIMHPPTYTGIWDVARKTYMNEGIRGMYKGLTPNLMKVAPALSITWVVYENSKRIMGLH